MTNGLLFFGGWVLAAPKFVSDEMRRAHQRLHRAFVEKGYTLPELRGAVPGVAVYDQDFRYPFAWHTRFKHLLFYVRKEALNIRPTMRLKATATHPAGRVKQNPSGETLVYIRSDAEAEMLLGWLLSELPLPMSSSH